MTEYVHDEGLQLGEIEKIQNKASALFPQGIPAYVQDITYFGDKLYLHTNEQEMEYLCYRSAFRGSGTAVIVPVDEVLRHRLNVIESFVRENVKVPKPLIDALPQKKDDWYKGLYQGMKMTIALSKFCILYRGEAYPPVMLTKELLPSCREGTFRFKIEVEKVYMGPHLNGQLCSLNLRVVSIDHIPKYQ